MANAQRATQDIKEILGFSEAEELMGKDISGKARRERKLEGGMAAYVFFDNLAWYRWLARPPVGFLPKRIAFLGRLVCALFSTPTVPCFSQTFVTGCVL